MPKKTTKKTASNKKTTGKKSVSTKKKSTKSRSVTKKVTEQPVITQSKEELVPQQIPVGYETRDDLRVLSHLMYMGFLVSGALAAYYTFNTFNMSVDNTLTLYYPVKGLLWLAWAYVFKTLGHRIHYPHH